MSRVYTGENVEEFIFGEGTTYEGLEEAQVEAEPEVDEEDVEVEAALKEFGVTECVDEPEVACYRIALENEQNYNMIMNAMMTREFSVLESTGEEIVYEAEQTNSFFEKIKQMIGQFWTKVQGVIKKVMDFINEKINLNKAFVKKYKGMNLEAPTKEKEFKGYNFKKTEDPEYDAIVTVLRQHVKASDVAKMNDEEASKFMEDFKAEFENVKNQMRGTMCGQTTVSADEYEKELKIAYFGSEEPVKLELPTFSALIDSLEKAIGAKKAATNTFKATKKVVSDLTKEVNTAQKELRKAEGRKNPGMKVAKCLTDAINASLGIMSKALSAQVSAIQKQLAQDRAMAVFYITHQPKKEKASAKNESATVDVLDFDLI